MANSQLEVIKAIADQLPFGVWVATAPRGELVYANRAFQDILGVSARADVAAGEYTAAYSILRRGAGPYPEAELPFGRALNERKLVMIDDIVVRRPDGSEVDVRAFGQPMFGPNGEVTQVSVSFIDITREVQAEAAKRKSEELIRTVVNAAPVILFSFDQHGTITLSEGRGLKRMGLTPGQLVGQSVYEVTRNSPSSLANSRRAAAGESFSAEDVFQGGSPGNHFRPAHRRARRSGRYGGGLSRHHRAAEGSAAADRRRSVCPWRRPRPRACCRCRRALRPFEPSPGLSATGGARPKALPTAALGLLSTPSRPFPALPGPGADWTPPAVLQFVSPRLPGPPSRPS